MKQLYTADPPYLLKKLLEMNSTSVEGVSAVCPAVHRTVFFVTFGDLVKVDIEALHDGAHDEAKGWTDGGRSEEETWEQQQEKHEQSHQDRGIITTILFTRKIKD